MLLHFTNDEHFVVCITMNYNAYLSYDRHVNNEKKTAKVKINDIVSSLFSMPSIPGYFTDHICSGGNGITFVHPFNHSFVSTLSFKLTDLRS